MTIEPRKPARKRRGQQGPTIADVARAAGVSPMTVSRVINNQVVVLDEKRERVAAAIEALGYVPNQAARSLAAGRQCRIALLYGNPSAAYLSEVLVGSLAATGECDAQLVIEQCAPGDNARSLMDRIRKHRVDAVLLPPPLCDDAALIAAIREQALPVAQIATGRPADGAIAVTIDDEGAARAMTARLIAQGHERIGFICGSLDQTTSALRRAGHERALRDAGRTPDPQLIRQGDFTYRSGTVAAEDLLALSPRPTAIFASNDDMAAAAVAVAHRIGLDVPHDVAVCGYDDTALATAIWPELTTVRQPIAEMARRATLLLHAQVIRDTPEGAARQAHICLDFELIARASDTPA